VAFKTLQSSISNFIGSKNSPFNTLGLLQNSLALWASSWMADHDRDNGIDDCGISPRDDNKNREHPFEQPTASTQSLTLWFSTKDSSVFVKFTILFFKRGMWDVKTSPHASAAVTSFLHHHGQVRQ
jgi:hypothetical protein